MNRQVQTYGEGKYRDTQDFHYDTDKRACKYQSPGQVSTHNALYDHLHQSRLGSRKLGGAIAPCCVQQVQDRADGHCGCYHTDELTDLLTPGCSAYDVTGLQVLRRYLRQSLL